MDEQSLENLRDYGDFDPLAQTIEHVNPCKCGAVVQSTDVHCGYADPEQMGLPKDAEVTVRRFFVICPKCNAKGSASRAVINAVIQWNMSEHSVKPDYKTLPLFRIAHLTKNLALKRLKAIRQDLNDRIADCEQRKKLDDSSKHPGPRYFAKLAAYRSWNHYAISLFSSQPKPKG